MASLYDLTIIGGGILGLATALKITAAYPRLSLLLLEKEPEFARRRDDYGAVEGSVGAALLEDTVQEPQPVVAEPVVAAASAPSVTPVAAPEAPTSPAAAAKRERRRQRRSGRPHGRPR